METRANHTNLYLTLVLCFLSHAGWGQCEGAHGDVNGDGLDTNLDALMIQSRFLGLLDYYPIDTNRDGKWPENPCTATSTAAPSETAMVPTSLPTDTPAQTGVPTATPVATDSPAPDRFSVALPGSVTMDFVLCPAGTMEMGAVDPGWSFAQEQPVHTVTFAGRFYLQTTEVTQGQWKAIMGSNPASFSSCGANCPVEWVSWDDCQAFLTGLNTYVENTGQFTATFRLPSEAEWEYACRAASTTRFSFGDSTCASLMDCMPCDLSDYAWFCESLGNPYGTKPVGGKLPNAWGLHDMHGSVWEWCQDCWHDDYTGAPTDGSPWVVPTTGQKVIRGGSWFEFAFNCRCASRYPGGDPDKRYIDTGLRVALSTR